MRSGNLRRLLPILLPAVIALAVLAPVPATALSCAPRPADACALVNNDSEIFVGRVLAKQDEVAWRMRVVRSFRGTAQGVVTVLVWAGLDYAALEVGRDYLFYVSKTIENGTVTRSTPGACATWMPLSDVSRTELDFLSRLGSETLDGRIVGSIVREGDVRTREPLAGIPISLSTGAATVTDAGGRFEFGGLSPGSYVLGTMLPRELLAIASENPIELVPHACAGVYVRAVFNTMVSGRVILPQRFHADGVTVSAMTPDGAVVQNAYADPQGAFMLSGLTPGEYIVGVNANGMPPTVENPFPPTFAPDTSDIRKAERIRLEVPAERTDVNIVVPRASPILTLAVTAKDESGRPVEAAEVVTTRPGGGRVRLGETDSRGVARVRLVGGVRQYLLISGRGGCATPVVIGDADPPGTLEVTLSQAGCREASYLQKTASLR